MIGGAYNSLKEVFKSPKAELGKNSFNKFFFCFFSFTLIGKLFFLKHKNKMKFKTRK